MHLLSGIKINICDFVKVRSVKEFFVFLKNKIIEAVTGRRPYEEDFEEGEKGYQVWEVLLYFFHIFFAILLESIFWVLCALFWKEKVWAL